MKYFTTKLIQRLHKPPTQKRVAQSYTPKQAENKSLITPKKNRKIFIVLSIERIEVVVCGNAEAQKLKNL